MFLQFLVFAQTLDFKIEYLSSTAYRQVIFKVQDFLTFQNPTFKSTNYYQLRKLLNFLIELQTGALTTSFTDTKFQSLTIIPKVKLTKCKKQKCWIGRVWLVEELYSYNYPFLIPDFFKPYYIF